MHSTNIFCEKTNRRIARSLVRRVVLYNRSVSPAFDRFVREEIAGLARPGTGNDDELVEVIARKVVPLIDRLNCRGSTTVPARQTRETFVVT